MENFFTTRPQDNKPYNLTLGSAEHRVYCHMTDDLGTCGGWGWTLVMKTDGNKVQKKFFCYVR